jgi:large subunit ribosomal protein L6
VSRVGKMPIEIPQGIEVKVEGNTVKAKSKKGELQVSVHPDMSINMTDASIQISRPSDSMIHRSLHGLSRTLVANVIIGVSKGFTKKLEIQGVGYRAEFKNGRLVFQLGYSHPIVFIPPEGIEIRVDGNIIIVEGIDKQLVGQVAAKIRSFKPPEPYKGKGIRYVGEYVRRKAGKAAGA